MQEKLKLSKSVGASTPAKKQRMQNVPYASAIGSIMYDMRCTRPDVAFTQNMSSRFQQNPGEEHWTAVKNILKYLRNTKDMFLVYGGNMEQELRVFCYTDAGYLTDADDLRSQTGYMFVLNGGAVDWKSTKQSIFATSSTDVEYIAAFDALKEAVWIQKFIYGLGIVPKIKEPISMYCGNTGAITIAKDDGVTKGFGKSLQLSQRPLDSMEQIQHVSPLEGKLKQIEEQIHAEEILMNLADPIDEEEDTIDEDEYFEEYFKKT
nr:putative retrotransposon protein [Tanacetum cinerariifolium]